MLSTPAGKATGRPEQEAVFLVFLNGLNFLKHPKKHAGFSFGERHAFQDDVIKNISDFNYDKSL